MNTCNQCGGLIGEAGTMISGRVCQCTVQRTSATDSTVDFSIPLKKVLSQEIGFLKIEHERRRDNMHDYIEKTFDRLFAIVEELHADNARLRDERDSFKVIAEEAVGAVVEISARVAKSEVVVDAARNAAPCITSIVESDKLIKALQDYGT